ncbi:MAG: NfeD family protein [Deltaproteobacteria bacterium]|nr:NfeD family protein [Deltaproteobacteria bacterium]MBW2421051.1 NfeD family protein [Deltaproteobacteria bacterium]
MSETRRGRTFARYLAFQLPGWVLAFVVLGFLHQGGWMPFWLAAGLLGLLAVVDLAIYPWARVAYEPGPDHGHAKLEGALGIALGPLLPDYEGWVRVGAERWRAKLEPGAAPLCEDAKVRVCEVKGHTLVVTRVEERVEEGETA